MAACLAASPLHALGLLSSDADFTLLASLGFRQAVDGAHPEGSALNDYAWSMQWFKGKLYVGTGRFENDGTYATIATMTGQIWAYTPGGKDGRSGTWALVYQSPQVLGIPREFGYRWMTVCNFGGTDYMFVSTAGTTQGNILRTADGVNFTALPRTGFPSGAAGFRTIVCFTDPQGRSMLITTPVGTGVSANTSYDSDVTSTPVVLANAQPTNASGSWTSYSPMGMGDSDVDGLFSLYVWHGALYAAADNPVSGFSIWRTAGCTTRQLCQPTWNKLIDRGAGRGFFPDGQAMNYGVSDMYDLDGSLYIAISSPSHEKPPAEVIRMRSDDTFEVLIGEPRTNFGSDPNAPPTNPNYPSSLRCGVPLEDIDGLGGANDCPPSSRHGAGFGPLSDAAGGYPSGGSYYFWRLFGYVYDPVNAPLGDNRLYAGTLSFAVGGSFAFAVLASTTGTDWTVVSSDGLGDSQQFGMRTIAGSPFGLFIGSAIRGGVYGCDVWIGIPQPDAQAPVTTLASPPSPTEGSTLSVRTATFSWSATDGPGTGSLPLTYAYRLDPAESNFSAFGSATSASYAKLPNGTYTFYAIAKDAAGNLEAPGAAPGAPNRRTFSVSAPDLPPTVSIQVAPATPNVTGNVNFGWVGSDDVTPAGSLTYDFWLAPTQSDPASFVAATTASYTALTDGSYTFHVMARDGSSNVGPEATASFVVARPPVVTIQTVPGPSTSGSVDLAWSATDDSTPAAAITFDYWLTPGQSDPGSFNASTSTNYANLVDGTYTLHVKAMDAAGNVSAEKTASFLVARPPDTQILTGPAGTIGVATATFTWTGSDDSPGTLTYASQLVGFDTGYSAFGTATSRSYSSLSNGTYTFQVKAKDAAGNVDPTPAVQTFTVAIADPPATPAPAAASVTGARTIHVTWTNVSNETSYNVQRCRLQSGACTFGALVSNLPADTTSFDDSFSGKQASGTYAYRVQACNSVGCSAWATTSNVSF